MTVLSNSSHVGNEGSRFKAITDTWVAKRSQTHPTSHKSALPPCQVLPLDVLDLAVVRGWWEGGSQADPPSSFSVLFSPMTHAWNIASWLPQLCGTQGPDLRTCIALSLESMNLVHFSVELRLTAPTNDPPPAHTNQHPYSQPHHQGAWVLIILSVTCPVCLSQKSRALAAGNLHPLYTAMPPLKQMCLLRCQPTPWTFDPLDGRPLLLTAGLWASLGVVVPLKFTVFCRKSRLCEDLSFPHALAVAPEMSLA